MKLQVIASAEVRRLLPMSECVEVVAEALQTLARGDAVLPLRQAMWLPDRSGLLGLMPGYLGGMRSLGLKAVSVMPGNHGTGYDSHQGVVLLFEVEHGCPVAVVDASSLTEIRTAAASAVATRALARRDAGDLALLGSGVQARSHLEAMGCVRSLRRVRIWSRSAENARRFAEREGRRSGHTIEVCTTVQEAVRDADLVCTTTAAREPVLFGEWLAPGAHVNAVGACFASSRELDTSAVARAKLYVDRKESALAEAGDFLIPKAEGAISDAHIVGEIGELLLGSIPGRRSETELTLFKSLGIAIEDLAAAQHVLRRAVVEGVGTALELSGEAPS